MVVLCNYNPDFKNRIRNPNGTASRLEGNHEGFEQPVAFRRFLSWGSYGMEAFWFARDDMRLRCPRSDSSRGSSY